MSASRAGLNYADILQKGIDKSSLNKLMESMVGYLREIAQGTIDNKVVTSAFSNVFGMSVSDMSAVLNLTDSDIQNIYESQLSQKDMGKSLISGIGRIIKNTHISQLTNNLFDNVVTTASTGIGDNLPMYALYKTADFLQKNGIDMNIPFINVYGFGLDLETSIMQLVKTGVTGLGLMSQLISGILGGGLSNLGNFLGLGSVDNLYNAWNASQMTERGENRDAILRGKKRYQSYSVAINSPFAQRAGGLLGITEEQQMSDMVGGGSTEDIQKSSLTQASESAKESNETTGGSEGAPEHNIDDLYNALFTHRLPVYTIDLSSLGRAYSIAKPGKVSSLFSQMLNLDVDDENSV